MLRKLDRYILSECAPTFALSLSVFTFVLLTHRMSQLFELVVAKGVPALDVLTLFVLALPTLLPLLLPISLLLAVLLAMGRLSSDGEIVAMRATGVGLSQNLLPIFVLSAAVTLVAAGISLWAQPAGARAFRQTLYDAVLKRINISTEAGTFTQIGEGITFFTQRVDTATGDMEGLFLYSRTAPMADSVIFAPKGKVTVAPEGLVLEVENAEIHQLASQDRPMQRTRAAKSRILIPILAPTAEESKTDEEPSGELFDAAYGPEGDRNARLEFQKRLSLPFSCLFLGLLGGSLGLHHTRVGKGRGFVLCLALLLLYYALLTASKTLGRRSDLNPELVMWFPNMVLATLAYYAYVRKNRERPLPLEAFLGRAVAWFGRRRRAGDAAS